MLQPYFGTELLVLTGEGGPESYSLLAKHLLTSHFCQQQWFKSQVNRDLTWSTHFGQHKRSNDICQESGAHLFCSHLSKGMLTFWRKSGSVGIKYFQIHTKLILVDLGATPALLSRMWSPRRKLLVPSRTSRQKTCGAVQRVSNEIFKWFPLQAQK